MSGAEGGGIGGGGSLLEAGTGRIEERDPSVEFVVVVGYLHSLVGADAVDVETADCGQQIGTDRQVRPAPVLQLDEDLRERFGHQVVGIGSGKQLVGQTNGCIAVPLEENAKGRVVASADRGDSASLSSSCCVPERRTPESAKYNPNSAWSIGRAERDGVRANDTYSLLVELPLMVEPDRYAEWLNPAPIDGRELRDLLVPAAPGLLDAIPVSTHVSNVRNNGPEPVKPLEISN